MKGKEEGRKLKYFQPRNSNFFFFRCLGNEVAFPDPDEQESALKDARLSFPSGHTSFSFQTYVFIVLYLLRSAGLSSIMTE